MGLFHPMHQGTTSSTLGIHLLKDVHYVTIAQIIGGEDWEAVNPETEHADCTILTMHAAWLAGELGQSVPYSKVVSGAGAFFREQVSFTSLGEEKLNRLRNDLMRTICLHRERLLMLALAILSELSDSIPICSRTLGI